MLISRFKSGRAQAPPDGRERHAILAMVPPK